MQELALQSTCAVQVTYKKARFEVAANPALSSPTKSYQQQLEAQSEDPEYGGG